MHNKAQEAADSLAHHDVAHTQVLMCDMQVVRVSVQVRVRVRVRGREGGRERESRARGGKQKRII